MNSSLAKSSINSRIVFFIVYLYSAFVLIRPHEYMSVFMGKPILPVLLIVGAILWLLFGRKAFYVSQHKIILCFLVIFSLSPILDGWLGGVVLAFNKFYPIVIFYMLIVGSMDSSVKLRWFYWLLVFSAFIMTLHGIGQVNNGIGWTGALPVMDGRITYVGIFNDPNDVGNFLVASLPPLIYLYSYYRLKILRMALLCVFATNMYGVFLTNSRGAILGIAGMGWVYLAQKYGVVRSTLVSVLSLPLIFLAPSRVSDIDVNEASAAGRVDAWYAGIQMLTNSKFLGVGCGRFTDHHFITAHNSFVLVFAELGVVGYFFWLAFLVLSFMMAYKMLKRAARKNKAERTENEALAYPIFYSLVGFCVTAFFLSRSYNVLLYILAALSVSNYINTYEKVSITLSNNFKLILGMTFGSIIMFYFLVKLLLHA